MNLLFLDAYFEPEQIAFTHLEHDLIERLVKEGNKIEVICPSPTRGISKETAKKYRRRKRERLYGGRVHVMRFPAPQEKRNPAVRAIRYFWCNYITYLIGVKRQSCDLVFCNSTPPTQGWIAGKVAKKLNVPLVYSLQDIFPDSLVTTGLSKKDSLLWRIGRKLENATYRRCSKIIVITQAMKENLVKKGVRAEQIEIINNWIDTDQIRPVKREENRLFSELGIDRSKYIVLYAGNFGEAQGAEIILDVAAKMQEDPNIEFVIFGGGSGYERAVEKAERLCNVFIHPLMPQDRIAEVYSMGDVALITCKSGVGQSGMPSKTWSIMACSTPVIASFDLDSELCRIIEKTKSGICVEPEKADEIVKAVKALQNEKIANHDIRAQMKSLASKEKCTSEYLRVFREALKSS